MAGDDKNMTLWEQVCTTDMQYTKERKKPYPHTDINATYMFKVATEAFGPLGQGWGYTVDNLDWRANGLVVVVLSLWHSFGGERSTPVQVIGCKLAEYDTVGERSRHIIDDEAPKKACTDAIKKWLSMLGVCADIYTGQVDHDHDGGTETGGGRQASGKPNGGTKRPEGAAAGGGPACPKCGGPMRSRTRTSDGAAFWGCANYPDCKGIVDMDKAAAEPPAEDLSDDNVPF